MQQRMTRRQLLERSATAALGWASLALLTACGGTASVVTSASSGATVAQTTTSAPVTAPATASVAATATASAGSTAQTTSALPSTIATVTTSAGATTAAPVASSAAPAAVVVALRIGSWLTRPTNQAVYNDQLIGPYQKLHPNVKIAVEYTSGTNTHITKMIAETAAGDPPDIIEVDFDDNQSFADKHVLLALDPLIATSKIDPNNYVKAALELGRYPQGSGKYWAWQTMLAVGVLYYNKTLFQNAGLPLPTGPSVRVAVTKCKGGPC